MLFTYFHTVYKRQYWILALLLTGTFIGSYFGSLLVHAQLNKEKDVIYAYDALVNFFIYNM